MKPYHDPFTPPMPRHFLWWIVGVIIAVVLVALCSCEGKRRTYYSVTGSDTTIVLPDTLIVPPCGCWPPGHCKGHK